MSHFLKHNIVLAEFDGWRIPFLSDPAFHSDFGYVIGPTPFNSENDYRNNCLQRLAGPHGKAWTRQRAVGYLAANTALSLHFIGTEIDRHCVWPGQALAYKIGELTIWDLHVQTEQTLGDAFDIREFHDAVLTEGGLPLETLRSQTGTYIEYKQGEQR